MDKFDLIAELVKNGVSEKEATDLKSKIKGNDLMILIGYFKEDQLGRASALLGKYGIKLGSRSTMNDNFLNAKLESIRSGVNLDETFGVMNPLSEAFTYAVEVSDQNRDRVLDWLDENQVTYQATNTNSFRVECGDRDVAYRTGRALSEILRKPTVRDSVEIEEKMSKNPNKRVKDAQEKMAKITPKDPNRVAATFRSGAGYHKGSGDPRKVDKQGRDAKYKARYDEEIEEPITEGVLGAMKPVNPLFRLRELAGLPMTNEDDFDGIEIAEIPASDPNGPLGAGTVGEPEDMDVDGMGSDPVADPMDDMDGGMDAAPDSKVSDIEIPDQEPSDLTLDIDDDSMPDTDLDVSGDIDDQAGVPGAIGSDPVEPMPGMGIDNVSALGSVGPGLAPTAPVAPAQSDAMSQIEDSLNSIQTGLADIRLSEYKSLIQKLQDLTNQAQMMGRDYLGEHRRLKR